METLVGRLEFQRNRLKKIFLYHGLLQVLLRVLGVTVLLFLLDYFIDPPRGMRIAMTLTALTYLGFAAYRHLTYPLSRRFSQEDIALALERKFTDLDGCLVSALQFHRSPGGVHRDLAPGLVEEAMRVGARKAEGLSWQSLFETRGVRKLFAVTGGVLLLVGTYGFMHPDLTGIWARRMFGGSLEWPRRTTLLIMLEGTGENFKLLSAADPYQPQEVLMASGTSLPIRVKVEGNDPGEVQVVEEAESLGKIIVPATRRSNGEYLYRIKNVREPMRFWVRGGDDQGKGRHVEVSVVQSPQILSTGGEYHYPEYLGLDPEVRMSSQVEGPEGTEVNMRFILSRPVQEASITVRTGGGEETLALTPDLEDPATYYHGLRLDQSGTYRVRLVGEEGFSNMDAALHSIIVKRDQSPRVKLYAPRSSDLDTTPRGLVIFRAVAEDDYGIASMGLSFKSAGEETYEIHEFLDEEMDTPYGSGRIVIGHVMDLESNRFKINDEERNLGPGDAVLYTVQARDSRPDPAEGWADTGRHIIDIVSENEKLRLLTERQIRLKEDVQSLRNQQAERMEKVREILGAFDEGEVGESTLVSLQINQNQLTNRYKGMTKTLAYIFDEYLFNRLDRSSPAALLLDRAATLQLEAPVSDSFSPAPYQSLVTLYRSGQLGEMDIMERLLVMLGLSLEVSETLSPETAGFLAKSMLATESEQSRDRIQQSLEAQAVLLETLDQLLLKMDEWEDYQELLQLFRDLIDTQNNLNILTREELRKGK